MIRSPFLFNHPQNWKFEFQLKRHRNHHPFKQRLMCRFSQHESWMKRDFYLFEMIIIVVKDIGIFIPSGI